VVPAQRVARPARPAPREGWPGTLSVDANRAADAAEQLGQGGGPVFRYGPDAHPAAKALEVLDMRHDDLTSGGDPLAGKR
jgi:hypothetical protein